MNLFGRTHMALGSILRRRFIQAQAQRPISHIFQPACSSCLLQRFSPSIQIREKHLPSMSTSLDDLSTWQRIKWNMGFHGNLRVSKFKLKLSGYHLYVCCTDFIDFPLFVKDAGLPDTFTSWFHLVLLHMWMLNVKLAQVGLEGEILKESAYKSMWQNTEIRLDTFKDLLGSEKRGFMQTFYNSMILSIMHLDEGLVGTDKELATALWVSLYGMKKDVDPQHLELMVEYVRKQVHFHDQLPADDILSPGYLPFLPLHGAQLDKALSESQKESLIK